MNTFFLPQHFMFSEEDQPGFPGIFHRILKSCLVLKICQKSAEEGIAQNELQQNKKTLNLEILSDHIYK